MSEENGKIDLKVLLTIMTTSIILWVYLLNNIIELSENDPASRKLIALGIMHCFLFLFSIFSLFSVYIRALMELKTDVRFKEKLVGINNAILVKMFSLWFPILILTIFAIISSTIWQESEESILSIVVFLFGGLIIVGIIVYVFKGHFNELPKIFANSFSITAVLIISFCCYIPIMGILFSDVKIETDKTFYSYKDVIKVSVKRSGYIFLPNINNVFFQFNDTLKDNTSSQENFSINLARYDTSFLAGSGMNFISAKFTTQVLKISHVKYQQVNISN